MKKIVSLLLVAVLLTGVFSFGNTASAAAENPYPKTQTIGGITTIPCTWYAWQQVYDNLGVAMPNFGNGGNWYSNAPNHGYSVGSVAKPKSIAVWSGGTYGHVSYVVSVNGSKMTVNEGGMHNATNTGPLNGNGIYNGNVVNSVVGQKKGNGSSKILVGFIYPSESTNVPSVTFTNKSSENSVSDTNAIVYCDINKPSGASVDKIGIRVRKDGDTYENGWEHKQAPNYNHSNKTTVGISWDFAEEIEDLTPTHATKYYYQFYAKIDGKDYWSDELSIKTTGSHQYSNACDKNCNVCGYKRTVDSHKYTNACDTTCNVCNNSRTVEGHKYTNEVDTNCNICDTTRTISYTGWIDTNGRKSYYENGKLLTNRWINYKGTWYFVDASGYRVTDTWKDGAKGKCYLTKQGYMATNCWVNYKGTWYFVDASGYRVTDTWKDGAKGKCYLTKQGYMAVNKWINYNGTWYYVNNEGYRVTNKWIKGAEGWCWLTKNGYMATNCWVKDTKGWCFVDAKGYAKKNCWQKGANGMCYLGKDNYMVTNTTLKIGSKLYKFDKAGVCTNV